MKEYNLGLTLIIVGLLLLIFEVTETHALTQAADKRICTTQDKVMRDPSGKISRSSSVLKQYQAIHPCPSTGLTQGKCPGWALDHVIPLACGGCDSIENLQWLPNEIKSAGGTYPKDRWERKINCSPFQIVK